MLSIAIAALIVGIPARVGDTSIPVTFQARAGRAAEVLKNLSQSVKMDFQTSPVMENEILVIWVKDVPLSDLMSRIATATSGEWKQEGAGFRLIASSTIRRQEEKTELAQKLSEVNKALASRITAAQKHAQMAAEAEKKAAADAKKAAADAKAGKTVTKTAVKGQSGDGDDDPTDAAMMDGQNWDQEEMFTKLLHDIDPSVIAQMAPGERLVFSTDPTRTQRSLGGNAAGTINDFIQKHNASAVEEPVDLDSDETGGMSTEQIAAMKAMMRRQSGKIGQIAKGLLVISNQEFGFMGGQNQQVELRLYDAKGNIAFNAQTSLADMSGEMDVARARMATAAGGADDESDPGTGLPTHQAQSAKPVKQTPIEYSDDSKALMKSVQAINGGGENFRLTMSDQLRQKLNLPNQYDPLSFSETDELFAYAKSLGKPFVADVPDSWYSMSPMRGGPATDSVEKVAARVAKGKIFQTVSDPGFTVLKPDDPVQARATQMNRLAMTALLQATTDKTVPSLDDFAAFAMNSPAPTMGELTQTYLMMFVPSSMMDFMSMGQSWSMLRLYGSLSSEQRSMLGAGGKVSLGSLTAAARTEVDQLTYDAPVKLKVDDGKQPKSEAENPFPFMDDMAGMDIYSASDYRTEPTEVAPAGLPANGFIEVKTVTESFGTPISIPGSINVGAIGILGPTELAFFQMMKDRPGGDAAGAMPKIGKLRIGQQMQLNFTIHLAPQVVIRQKLTDHRVAKDAQICDENSLPADFQKLVTARVSSLKTSGLGGAFSGAMGQGDQIHP